MTGKEERVIVYGSPQSMARSNLGALRGQGIEDIFVGHQPLFKEYTNQLRFEPHWICVEC